MTETVTHIEGDVSSDSARKDRFGSEKKPGRKQTEGQDREQDKRERDSGVDGTGRPSNKAGAKREGAGGTRTEPKKPETEEKFELICRDEESGAQIFKSPDGKLHIVGIKNLKNDAIASILQKAGIKAELDFPDDFEDKTSREKRLWLAGKEINVIPAIAGASPDAVNDDWYQELPSENTVPAELSRFVKRIKAVGQDPRSAVSQIDRLEDLEKEFSRAVVSGNLNEADQNVQKVDQVLSGRINALTERITEARRPEITGMRGQRTASEVLVDKEEVLGVVDKMVNLDKEGGRTSAEWDVLQAKLDEKLNQAVVAANENRDYRIVFEVTKGLEEATNLYRDKRDLVREVISHADPARYAQFVSKDTDLKLLWKLDRHFREIYDSLSDDEQNNIVGDINLKANSYFMSVAVSGWRGYDEAVDDLERTIGAKKDPEGLREWRAMHQIGALENSIRVKQLTTVPADWEDIPKHLSNIYNQIEGTDLSVEDLRPAVQDAITLIRNMPADTEALRDRRLELIDELEAFQAFHTFRLTMERNDMDPKDLINVFRQYFDDETWVTFIKRFEKDNRGRQFVDKEGSAVNLMDVSFTIYSERLRGERILMNMVEEMTKHSIAHKFNGATLSEMKRAVGFEQLSSEWKAKWEDELERLRQHFVKKIKDAGHSVDDWGIKSKIKITHELIQNWHTRETLQGASGIVTEKDFDDIDAKYRRDGENDEDFAKRFKSEFLGETFLNLRREEMRIRLVDELKAQGLKVKLPDGQTKEVDYDDIRESGFLGSVDSNTYYTAWMFEWSNYDGIRVFARDYQSNLDDDFVALVFHQNTNMFYGRHIDHIWEFYHDTNENRGRAKENDVNRIWKQYLPGKHHYLFPQNSLMGRWMDMFISEDQGKEIDRRAGELMREWDFDNEKYHGEYFEWMKNVVRMDMVENGEISMGGKTGEKKLSEVFRDMKVKKFEMIDLFVDRSSHLQFVSKELFQDYLANPTEEKFIEINRKVDNFYSSRDARLFPWVTLALRGHWEVVSKHRQRLFNRRNLNAAAGESLTNDLISIGQMERKAGEKEKRNLFGFSAVGVGGFFGTTPFRRLRQGLEDARRIAWEMKTAPFFVLLGAIWGGFTEFIRQFPRQVFGGGNR